MNQNHSNDDNDVSLSSSDDDSSNSDEENYNPYDPMVREIHYGEGKQQPNYDPMGFFDEKQHGTKFFMPNGIDASVESILGTYLPDTLIQSFANTSNKYGHSKSARFITISGADIINFLLLSCTWEL